MFRQCRTTTKIIDPCKDAWVKKAPEKIRRLFFCPGVANFTAKIEPVINTGGTFITEWNPADEIGSPRREIERAFG